MKRKLLGRGAALLALLLALVIMTGCAEPASNDPGTALEVYCFQAGAADAFLITTENAAVLIDTGEKGFGSDIVKALEARGIEKLDYLIITHFDQDHVGGAAKVLKKIAVDTVLQSNCPKDSNEYKNYLDALEGLGLTAATVTKELSFTLDGVRYTVDPPRQSVYATDESNNSSLIVSVKNGANTLLFMGDAETERLKEFLSSGLAEDCDFIKIPHHGREDALMDELIKATAPEYAVITSSEKEPEHEAVLAALKTAGAQTFLTRTAPVIVKSDGKTLTAAYETPGPADQ